MSAKFLLLFVLFSSINYSASYKIGIFAPYISNSQLLFNKRVAEVLADAGHDVKMFIIYMMDHNYKFVKIQPNVKYELVNASSGIQALSVMEEHPEVLFEELPLWDARARAGAQIFDHMATSCELLLKNTTFLNAVRKEHFDIALTHMYSFCNIGVIKVTDIPSWIWVSSGALMEHMADAIGVPKPPSYCTPLMMDAGDNLTFVGRVKSFIGNGVGRALFPMMVANKETAYFRKYFGDDFPSLLDLAAEAPVVFINSNELYDFACPTLHKVVNIGGLGIKHENAKPLEGEYAKRVNASADGHIVMTFGSFAPMYLMPAHWKDAFLHTFEAFPNVQFFLRYEKDDLNDRIPKNVHLSKWLPQTDLLQHEKCRGLITHGGYNSVQDAIHAAMPIIAIPLFGDQHKNGHLVEKLGTGINLAKSTINRETVQDAVRRVIENPSYKAAAVRLLAQVRRKPVSPDQLLVRWTEFVAEFRTLENLVPFGTHLGFIEYHSLDVIVFLLGVVIFTLFIAFILLRCFIRCACNLCRGKSEKVKRA